MELFSHGGARKGAGKKKQNQGMQNHLPRPEISNKIPLHINLKIVKGLPNLRTKNLFKIVKQAMKRARLRGFSINQFAILKNHIHLIVESENKKEMAKGMQALTISLAKSINGLCKRRGKVFVDRYHLHILKTPQEVKNALIYLFKNAARHYKLKNIFDPYSSLIAFSHREKLLNMVGFLVPKFSSSFEEICDHLAEITQMVDQPKSYLLKIGWQKANNSSCQNLNYI